MVAISSGHFEQLAAKISMATSVGARSWRPARRKGEDHHHPNAGPDRRPPGPAPADTLSSESHPPRVARQGVLSVTIRGRENREHGGMSTTSFFIASRPGRSWNGAASAGAEGS